MQFFKNKSTKKIRPTPPRLIDDIKNEYNQLSAQAANAQYLVFVHSKELEQINGRLLQVNQEAAARQELDKKVAEETQNG